MSAVTPPLLRAFKSAPFSIRARATPSEPFALASIKEIGRAHAELQSHSDLVCRLLLEKKKANTARRNDDTPHIEDNAARKAAGVWNGTPQSKPLPAAPAGGGYSDTNVARAPTRRKVNR